MQNFGVNGRMGNQCHQLAFMSSMSRKKGVPYFIPKEWPYSQYFKINPPVGKQENAQKVNEISYEYSDYSNLDYTKDIDYNGFFQNEKYFDDKVKSEIQFKDDYKSSIKTKFSRLFTRPTISIGVRRTDYLNLPYYQLGANYYISALFEHFPEWRDYNLIFISDDLHWCKEHFGCLTNAFFPESKDMEQMCLSSLCDHFIIANSTFHWWAAFMGEKEGTKVVQPTKLFAGKLLEQHGDVNFYSDRWVKHEEKPVDLSDVTFTIPVFKDSEDRKQNLDLTVCLLQKNFITNIIIGEQGTDELKQPNCEYVKFDLPYFHRTKMLNDMARMSKTPFIANWDCDVFTPPMQILEAVHKLRQGQEMVFPYEWDFFRVSRKQRKNIFPYYDIGVFFSEECRAGGMKDSPQRPSLGGAVLWRKQKFFEIGGENEYFISFGPEDVERWDRARILGVNIERVKGKLFHIQHWCGPDSSVVNPYFKKNRDLHHQIAAMDKKTLQEYINSWPWHKPYTESYYENISEDAVKSRDAVFEILGIDRDLKICDAGGGVGQWGVGLKNYTCIDYRVPLDALLVGVEQYIDQDLRKPFNMGEKFDVVLGLEVAEHLEEEFADVYVENLINLAKDDGVILFSAAIPFQGGNNHVNEQWQTYWVAKFYNRGYWGIMYENLRRDKRPSLWYRQNLMVFRKHAKSKGGVAAEDYVLPEYYLEICKHLKG
jgi:2-polyprenyl-3-methyl-5-hydroxy-6-metoxy-1,4-benzoquinol methylase